MEFYVNVLIKSVFPKVIKVGPNEVKQGANKKWNLSENIIKNIFDYTTMLFI